MLETMAQLLQAEVEDLVHLRTKAAPEIAVLTKPPRMLQRFKMALAQLMNSRFAITTQNCRILALRVDQAHQRTIRADLGPVRTRQGKA